MKSMFCLLLMLPILAAWMPKPKWSLVDHKTQTTRLAKKKVAYLCISTGEFNLSPKSDKIFMETWCVEDSPKSDKAYGLFQVKDITVKRAKGHFPIPFKNSAKLSIKVVKGKPVLTLRYRVKKKGEKDKEMVLTLPFLKGKPYTRDFSHLVPDDIEPRGKHIWVEE